MLLSLAAIALVVAHVVLVGVARQEDEGTEARIPDVDRSAITGEAAAWLADVSRESVRTGIWGWHDDALALVGPWGLDLADIKAPVAIWQGAQDRMTPPAHGEWLASHIPAVQPHLLPDHGHLSLGLDSFGAILDDLLTIAPI
jgi:pimeloyl-ACP methyl ester carboxylesterase